jgi:hypothetical protein
MNNGVILRCLLENRNSFSINYEHSDFITRLLVRGEAQLILVIQSKDNKFFKLHPTQISIEISRSRISVSKRTTIQLQIQAKGNINFNDNDDLSGFYQQFKDKINLPKNSILGFSNVVLFDGSSSKALELFEKKVDPSLKSDVKVELGSETNR